MVTIREETKQDIEGVTLVNELAFGRPEEAHLVERLRSNQKIILSLVAIQDEEIVGHILFSPMHVETTSGDSLAAIGLGPVAVLPQYQGQSIGSALIIKGLAACRETGHGSVFLLGHASYYPRFGFQPAGDFGITCTYDVPADAFMALELEAGALENVSGVAYYQPEFDSV